MHQSRTDSLLICQLTKYETRYLVDAILLKENCPAIKAKVSQLVS